MFAAGALSACAGTPDTGAPDRAAAIAARIERPRIARRTVLVTDHGARPGSAHDARPALLRAIDDCAHAGGGRVVVPAGDWRLDGPIHLRSGVDLHVARGAVMRFTPDAKLLLPPVLTRWEGVEAWNYSPLIYGQNLSDVAITGAGRFEGAGEAYFFPWRAKQRPDRALIWKMGADGVPVNQRVFGEGHWLRPAFVQLMNCRRVLIDGPTFADSPFWVIHPVYCTHVTVRRVSIVSRHLNSDGVDPDSCEDVLIEGCRIDVSDDCIAIKSGRDQDGWRVGKPSRRIAVRDCDLSTDVAGAFSIGSEMSGGVSDVVVERLRIPRAEFALYLKSNLDRGGYIERVLCRDVTVGETKTLLRMTAAYHSPRGGAVAPRLEDIAIRDVRCESAREAFNMIGPEALPIRNVSLENVRVGAAASVGEIRHVTDLTRSRVFVNGVAATD